MTFEKINSKVIGAPVAAHSPVLARRGAMLGYEGQIGFRPIAGQGHGMTGMAASMMAGESNQMMAAEGTGKVYYGFKGLYVTIIDLNGSESLTVEADRLLAHDAHLNTSVQIIAEGGIKAAVGGMMTGQGLATTQIHGQGSVAVLSHGGAFPIAVNGSGVAVDPQAYVGHTGNVTPNLKAKVGWREAVGRGSGEAFQLHLTGQGTVYVQASEVKF